MSNTTEVLKSPFWGVSNRVLVPALLIEVIGAVLTSLWPEFLSLGLLPRWCWLVVGLVTGGGGLWLILQARRVLSKAQSEGRFPVDGVYLATRNPMEAGWIFGVLPGLAFLADSWIMLAGPVVAWSVFRDVCVAEEAVKLARYGDSWRSYAVRVGRLVPNFAKLRRV